jgi:hypothetical protein
MGVYFPPGNEIIDFSLSVEYREDMEENVLHDAEPWDNFPEETIVDWRKIGY